MGNLFISEKHMNMLDELSKRWNMTHDQVVEMLVEDRYSVSDTHANANRRDKAWYNLRKNRDTKYMSKEMAWRSGYNTGWIDFQTRHKDNDNILVVE